MTALADRTLGDLVAEVPRRGAVFDRLGLDYCCHGRRSLADACATAGLDAASVAAELTELPVEPADHPTEPVALIDHIEATHHRYLDDELPALAALAQKVARVHGRRHPETQRVSALVAELGADLEPHLRKEEQVLFPAIRALCAGAPDLPFGPLANPIGVLSTEHDRAGALLEQLRDATGGYQAPADGCASYRSLYERLEILETDIHRHVHLENNVLFPAALTIERT